METCVKLARNFNIFDLKNVFNLTLLSPKVSGRRHVKWMQR